MTSLGTVARRLIECGGAVEAPGPLWHVARNEAVTYCDEDCRDWPRVAHSMDRFGIWCRICLMFGVEEYGLPEMQEPPLCRCAQGHHTCGQPNDERP